ncbi:hypothetical protein ASE17_02230 [Phenylobacterium sp. Root77]|uniref:DUF2955 domain-containing protein n=1 Tax=unclassified Phenylobacterium TaxID=2640670 RepID=UPI0007000714|nr:MULTISPECIES: DUF2955 domain-containing protein [unclassified Phenylobacterium]KQW71728.1 hypothetical protein ASC73_06455 [Phenylobacterium sp. Root1277]KQW94648.1 hypothetical protein ASC79_02600 [Phenylobacterium sp. Root1290]KRC44341.1 hypothetical protein ASE17_02230 [Phenylobacterium sp. Root77]
MITTSTALFTKPGDLAALARRDTMLRLAVGVTLTFTLSELMGWRPSFLAPVLFTALITALPAAPPFRMGLILIVVMAAAAGVAFALPSLLRGTPIVMVGVLGLLVFFALLASAQQRAKLPALLLLISVSTIPVAVMVAPAQAGLLPVAMVRSMTLAVLTLWLTFAVWPRITTRTPPDAGAFASPAMTALAGTCVVMPLMLIYLMFGLADALPVLVTTALLVLTFDVRQGAMQGMAMMLANLVGGLSGVTVYLLVVIAPSLVVLALLTFLVAIMFAARIEKGGPGGAVAVITSNSSLIILSSALAAGPDNSGIWLTRLFQFALACMFAIGMMTLVWGLAPAAAKRR